MKRNVVKLRLASVGPSPRVRELVERHGLNPAYAAELERLLGPNVAASLLDRADRVRPTSDGRFMEISIPIREGSAK